MSNHKNVDLLVLAAWAYLLSGCVPAAVSHRANPRFQEQSKQIQTVSILPPKVKVYQIDAGGVREEITDWSSQARTNIVLALDGELRANTKTAVKIVSEESLTEEKERALETRALYTAVAAMISLHTYFNPGVPSYFFEEKLNNFDYSLGTEVNSLANGADALVFLDAQDHIWTAGRQALQALGVILGVGAGVATGIVIVPQLTGGTGVRAALVDSRTGDILWINAAGAGSGTDLRDWASASQMVGQLFKDFPVAHGIEPKEESR
jgi:hypothetical protein